MDGIAMMMQPSVEVGLETKFGGAERGTEAAQERGSGVKAERGRRLPLGEGEEQARIHKQMH
jgi:hypothetical protein